MRDYDSRQIECQICRHSLCCCVRKTHAALASSVIYYQGNINVTNCMETRRLRIQILYLLRVIHNCDAHFLNKSFFWAASREVTHLAGSLIELNRTLILGLWRKTHSQNSTSNTKRTKWASSTNSHLPRSLMSELKMVTIKLVALPKRYQTCGRQMASPNNDIQNQTRDTSTKLQKQEHQS